MNTLLRPPAEPAQNLLFRPVADFYGRRLALVFGNHAAGGVCPFAAAPVCHHCDIGLGEGLAFDSETNLQRLAWYEAHYRREWPSVAHLVLYNSGSFLNPREMPPKVLGKILAVARRHDSVKVVSLDSRESFVNQRRVLRVTAGLRADQCARIIIGLETANDRIRNQVLEKQMTRASLDRAFESLAQVADRVGRRRIGVDVNILVGGPGTTASSAVEDAAETARFSLEKSRVPVDFNVHPYYRSRRGAERFPAHPRCSFAILLGAAQAIANICLTLKSRSCIFVGCHDEGHDSQKQRKHRELSRYGSMIDRFNESQDTKYLTRVAN
jgi:hypothetical protein